VSKLEKKNFLKELMETGQFYIDEDGHLILLGEYAILSPAGVLLKLQQLLEENVGKEKTEKILMSLGEFQVESAARRYIKRFHFQKIDKRQIADLTFKIINSLGWGDVTIKKISFKDKTADVILKNSTLSLKYKQLFQKNSERPIDYWLAGILKKHFSLIFGEEMEIKEVKCLAKGDEFCEFIVISKS